MLYFYIKAIHIIFVVTWFAGLFYMPRLFIYFTEANEHEAPAREILQKQFMIMMRRLWFGITWPSAVITLILGVLVMIQGGWWGKIIAGEANWLAVKLALVLLLYGYHVSLQVIFQKMSQYQFPLSSMKLRIWNEVATVFLFAIVMLATVKESISFVWGLGGLALLVSLLLIAIKVYKRFR
jgi:putative membrane protein